MNIITKIKRWFGDIVYRIKLERAYRKKLKEIKKKDPIHIQVRNNEYNNWHGWCPHKIPKKKVILYPKSLVRVGGTTMIPKCSRKFGYPRHIYFCCTTRAYDPIIPV